MNLKIISAGAGSGKTYRLTNDLVNLLKNGTRASGVVATTFTTKAAAELHDRVQTKLLQEGLTHQADELNSALIGTVHGLGVKLLKRFAFEAGVSPQVDIIAEGDRQQLFNLCLSQILSPERMDKMNDLIERLGMSKKTGAYDWRKDVKDVVDVARANGFGKEILLKSKSLSFETFKPFLGEADRTPMSLNHDKLQNLLEETIGALENATDKTKVTADAIVVIRQILNELKFRGSLQWYQWVKLTKTKVSAKSKDLISDLVDFAAKHTRFPQFQADIRQFTDEVFDTAIDAIDEYDRFKKQRGLIDYTDMETHINELLDHPDVAQVLQEELDLLLVDEFQDTSPLQLELFLKMSAIAKTSIWVGDPKQSMYGFRGADPKLMQAIIEQIGVKDEDILSKSYRSRPDIVHATNAIFTKAFPDLPVKQVALEPARLSAVSCQQSAVSCQQSAVSNQLSAVSHPSEIANPKSEIAEIAIDLRALIHWHFRFDGEGKKQPASPWTENCIARSLYTFLQRQYPIGVKGSSEYRVAQPGDVAILCRSNDRCEKMAEALRRAGLKAAIAAPGLLSTPEAKLITACLRFLLNRHDSLAIAEILLLADGQHIADILEDRLTFLDNLGDVPYDWKWAAENPHIGKLNALRAQIIELSSTEILNLLLEELDLRRITVAWGHPERRLENIEAIRHYAVEYEENCNRLHEGASLGGFLLRLNHLAENAQDLQSAGESPDAVNILTYHKSKGLEYPVVILNSLEAELRDSLFGIHIVAETDEIDLKNILGNRYLRFWVNPYGDQIQNTAIEVALNASPAKTQARNHALQEEARLLYVGITRARDYLILPTGQRATGWLNRVWHNGIEENPVLEPGEETPFLWQNAYLTKSYEEFLYPKDFTRAQAEQPPIAHIAPRGGKKSHIPYHIDPEKDAPIPADQIKIGALQRYGTPFPYKEGANPRLVAKAISSFLTADHPAFLDHTQRTHAAQGLIERMELDDLIEPHYLLKHANAFFAAANALCTNHPSPQRHHRRYPIRYHHQNRLFETDIDFLWVGNGQITVIQNSPFFSPDPNKLRREAKRQAPMLYLTALGLESTFGIANIATYVHFPLLGMIVPIKF